MTQRGGTPNSAMMTARDLALAEAAELRKALEKAEKALEPFAGPIGPDDDMPDDTTVTLQFRHGGGLLYDDLTCGDFHRARKVLTTIRECLAASWGEKPKSDDEGGRR